MAAIPWFALGVLAALIFFALALRAARPARPAADSSGAAVPLPPTPLQRAARWTLAAGLVLAGTALALIARLGVDAWWNDDSVRLRVTLLMVAALVASAAPMAAARRSETARGILVDERDLQILGRAPSVQGGAVLVCLALWTIALMQTFHDQGQVPMPFLVLLCWSCLLVYALALPAGILLGYWRR